MQVIWNIWKFMAICVGLACLVTGSFFTVGQLKSEEASYTSMELAKLQLMSEQWEQSIWGARASLQDQIMRHDAISMVTHPEEWVSWRVMQKFESMRETWTPLSSVPRGLALIDVNGEIHSVVGDTVGLWLAMTYFGHADSPDFMITTNSNHQNGIIGLRYALMSEDGLPSSGQLIAMIDPVSVLTVPENAPSSWMLMGNAKSLLFASATGATAPISPVTWNLLQSSDHGLIDQGDGNALAYCRLTIPGVPPMLLVSEVKLRETQTKAITILALVGLGAGLAVWMFRGKPSAPKAEKTSPRDPAPDTDGDAFRQLFQLLSSPVCLVDGRGSISRINRVGRDLLKIQKGGVSRDDLTIVRSTDEFTVEGFLEYCAAQPTAIAGACQIRSGTDTVFEGTVKATRLGNEKEKGLVLVEFAAASVVYAEPASSQTAPTVGTDIHDPDPVILLGQDGNIREYNPSAFSVCTKIGESTRLWEIMPGVEEKDLPAILSGEKAKVESMYGSSLYEFRCVAVDSGMLLYGHRKNDTQSLGVAFNHAIENFNTLCSLTPSAVLMVDPWEHTIREANASAIELFGLSHHELRGRRLDEFVEVPWEDSQPGQTLYVTRHTGELQPALFDHELIKVEGEPTLLIVLTKVRALGQSPTKEQIEKLADSAEEIVAEIEQESARPKLLPGPAMLVVNNPTVRDVARRMLDKIGIYCETFSSLDDATVWIISHDLRPKFVAVDLSDFDETIDWINMVRERCGDVPCLGLTSGGDVTLPNGGLNAYLTKPFEMDSLEQTLMDLDVTAEAASGA